MYIAVCKDTDALHIERIEADPEAATRLLDKAKRTIDAQHPPARINDDPTWFECRMCSHHAACHAGEAAAGPAGPVCIPRPSRAVGTAPVMTAGLMPRTSAAPAPAIFSSLIRPNRH